MLSLSPETEELIRAKAKAAGKSPDEYLRAMVGEEVASLRRGKLDLEGVWEIIERNRKRPVLDPRPAKQILEDVWELE